MENERTKEELYRCKYIASVCLEAHDGERVLTLVCGVDQSICHGCDDYAAEAGTDLEEMRHCT